MVLFHEQQPHDFRLNPVTTSALSQFRLMQFVVLVTCCQFNVCQPLEQVHEKVLASMQILRCGMRLPNHYLITVFRNHLLV